MAARCFFITLRLMVIWQFIKVANGLDIDRAMEKENIPCFVPTEKADLNFTWVSEWTSVPIWYNTHSSVLNLYINGIDISGISAAELQEDELYYNACITYTGGNPNQTTESGFGGRQVTFQLVPINNNGIDGIRWHSVTPASTRNGTSFITMTDNKTYFLFVQCQQNRMTWVVSSVTTTLPSESVRQIHDHVLSLGFRREHFTGLRFDYCSQSRRHN